MPLKSGRCDYLLIVDRRPVGVVEAKRAGTLLIGVAEAQVTANLARAQRLRQSILRAAFGG